MNISTVTLPEYNPPLPTITEERIDKLERKLDKLKNKQKKAKSDDGDSDTEEAGPQQPSKIRLGLLMGGTFCATVGIAAFSGNIVLTAIAAGITGSTAKSILRTVSSLKRVAILGAATGIALATDHLLQQYTTTPSLQLGTIALATDIGVLNREIKLWILGKGTNDSKILKLFAGAKERLCSWCKKDSAPVELEEVIIE